MNTPQKTLLDRIVAMLTKLAHRGYRVRGGLRESRGIQFDTDSDSN